MNHLPMNVRVPIEKDNPSICRDEALCIKCGQCRDVCTDYIGVHGTYTLEQTGGTAVCINCVRYPALQKNMNTAMSGKQSGIRKRLLYSTPPRL